MTVTGIANSLRGLGIGLPVLMLCVAPAAAAEISAAESRTAARPACGSKASSPPSTAASASIRPGRTRSSATRTLSAKQQAELDRLGQQSQRLGCQGGGFFALFSGQSPQCGPLNNQIQQMRGNLDRYLTEIQRLQGNSGEREGQRRGILVALGQNDCGPQYRQYANSGPGGFFENLFGGRRRRAGARRSARRAPTERCASAPATAITSRSPIRPCRASSPTTNNVPAPVPGDRDRALQPPQSRRGRRRAVSASGRPYSELPNAFSYRKQFNAACSAGCPANRGPMRCGKARRPDRRARRYRRHRGAGQAAVAAALRRAGQTGQARPGRPAANTCRLRRPARRAKPRPRPPRRRRPTSRASARCARSARPSTRALTA